MANVIKLKNSGTANSTPTSLEVGELAINYADGILYYKNSSNAISILSSALSAQGTSSIEIATTPPASPSEGDLWFESDTGKTFIYYDSFWVETSGADGSQGSTGSTGPEGGTTTLTTKGDILARGTSESVRLPVGTDGKVLTANSSTTTGLEWVAPTVYATVANLSTLSNTVTDISGNASTLSNTVTTLSANVSTLSNTVTTLSANASTLSNTVTLKANIASPTFTGTVTLAADPASALQAATKQYVDNVSAGIVAKPSVLGATVSNVTGTYYNGPNDDGVGATLTHDSNGVFPSAAGGASGWGVGKGILLKSQTNKEENGRYFVSNMGSVSTPYVLTRCGYCDEASEIPGAYIFVQDGTYAGTGWIQVVADPATFVVGTDDIDVFQFSGAGTYVAGAGIVLTDNSFSVDTTTIQARVTDVSDTEIGYLNGVTSAIQTQLDEKQAIVANVSNTEIGYLDGVTSAIQTQLDNKQAIIANVSDTEIGYLDGVTSAIQTQLNTKASTGKAIAMAIVFGG